MEEVKKINNVRVDEMFKAGAHFGYSKLDAIQALLATFSVLKIKLRLLT